MNTEKVTFRYIILVPHRETVQHLDEYRQKLFSGGVPGAFSFPAAAPLAEISRSLSRDELTELAKNIRCLTEKTDGKILCGSAVSKPPQTSFFGPLLKLSFDEETFPLTAREKISRILTPPVLCAAIVHGTSVPNALLETAPALSFRAAFLANLAIRPLESNEYSTEWKISIPTWLPKCGV